MTLVDAMYAAWIVTVAPKQWNPVRDNTLLRSTSVLAAAPSRKLAQN
jgi:hypothetical protein